MSELSSRPVPSHPLRWFPEFFELGQRRLRGQARLLGLALLVGVAAGLGAIVFYSACQIASRYVLEGVAGYAPRHPGGEPPMFAEAPRTLHPWLLLAGALFAAEFCTDDKPKWPHRCRAPPPLVVVSNALERQISGIVRRADISSADLRYVHGEISRTPGSGLVA